MTDFQTAQDILNRPFDKKDIKKNYAGFDYVEAQMVIRRLNEAFGHAWSFAVVSSSRDEDTILVLGSLEGLGITKQQYGSAEVKRFKNDHATKADKVMDIGNDFKAATSDALKKCATLFGVALHLYGDEESNQEPTQEPAGATEEQKAYNEAFKTSLAVMVDVMGAGVALEAAMTIVSGKTPEGLDATGKPEDWRQWMWATSDYDDVITRMSSSVDVYQAEQERLNI